MLLAALDAISSGFATPIRIEWSEWLRERFASYFEVVRSANDSCTPENPFYYLKSDGFWKPCREEMSGERQLDSPPSVADASSGKVFARFTPDWALIVSAKASRAAMREAILARYFPAKREQLTALIHEEAGEDPNIQGVGRSAAFRRQVLEIYDYQCCACGLRIWIPDRDLTFVDAAHVIPFSESRNDHPTNGIALCKNHHWAMDQGLIAPDPERVWRVSNEIDARRSKGEEELGRLGGQRMLLPVEPAYAPNAQGLYWRFSKLKSG
jgi:putative restriction endonuclease